MSTYRTNCKSCGGPLNIADPKCPFCGTKNINMTDINLASGEAANFIFKLPNNTTVNGNIYMSLLAVPELETMVVQDETTNIYTNSGAPLITLCTSRSLNMKLNLRAVNHEDNSLYNLTIQ